ncbi:MAG: hypothetical protein KatS3mg109_0627 [Pirellulaceae bacterium]|nr:MAG: hypothetical protein KatS3mg109_0627 [Pirellulaceae bacterium]GIW93450.1 MAG: hypothetical protein KatS3mg110_1491 [Pirellulaceae bacterium]
MSGLWGLMTEEVRRPEQPAATLWERFDPQVLAALGSLELKARYLVEGFLTGLHRSPFHGFSVEFSEYREYYPGDDLRHLDWRVYARCDRLYVKQYTQETNVRFYLLCDASGSMAYRGRRAWESKLEVAKLLAAAFTWILLRQNDAAGMLTLHGLEDRPELVRPSQRPSQLGEILRRLARLEAAKDVRLATLLDYAGRLFHRRSIVLVFTDLLEDCAELEPAWKKLRFQGHECLVFQILDADEIEFPFDHPAVFEDLETGQRRRVRPAAVRDRYRERFERFMQEHRRLLEGLEIPLCLVRTDQSPWQTLGEFLSWRRRWL